jgi:hypothetical protein
MTTTNLPTDILQRYGAKKEELYGRIKKELKEVHQAIFLVHIVTIAPFSSQIAKLGYEPTQLRRLAYAIEARIQKI